MIKSQLKAKKLYWIVFNHIIDKCVILFRFFCWFVYFSGFFFFNLKIKKQQHLSWLLGGNEMFANKIQVNMLDFKSLEN